MSSWEDREPVASFPRYDAKGTQEIRVGVCTFGSKAFGYIREGHIDQNGDWHPTRKGLTLNFLALADLHESLGLLLLAMEDRWGGPFASFPKHSRLLDKLSEEFGISPRTGDRIASTRDTRARHSDDAGESEHAIRNLVVFLEELARWLSIALPELDKESKEMIETLNVIRLDLLERLQTDDGEKNE